MPLSQDYRAWLRLVLAVLLSIAAWIVWAPTLRATFAPYHELFPQEDSQDFDNGSVAPSGHVEVTGYRACPYGWCLGPGQSGSLTYRFIANADRPFLKLWFYRPAGGTSQVSLSLDDGATWRPVTINAPDARDMEQVDLGTAITAGQQAAVRFAAANPTPAEVLVLDKLTVVYGGTARPPLPRSRAMFGMVVSFGLAAVIVSRRRLDALTTVLILALGASLRYSATLALADVPLEPDAIGYRAFARKMALFTDTGFLSARFDMREPLYILLVRVYFKVFGDSAFGMRLLGIVLGTATIWGFMRIGRDLFGRVPGQLIGLLIALNGPLVQEPGRALRLELELVLVAAYFFAAFVKPWRRVMPAAAVLTGIGLLLILTRSTYLPVVVALNAYALYRPGQLTAWAGAMAVTVALLAIVIVPYRYNMYRVNGDPFYDTATYARWSANMEFAGRPGFPTRAQLETNAYLGPPISYRDYMLGLHTPGELIVGTVRGYYKLFRAMIVSPWVLVENVKVRFAIDLLFQLAAVAGFVLALGQARYRWVPLTFVLLESSVAFLYDRNLLEPYRHSYAGWPLVLFAATLAVLTLLGRAPAPAPIQASSGGKSV
jgi:hypothetical protein